MLNSLDLPSFPIALYLMLSLAWIKKTCVLLDEKKDGPAGFWPGTRVNYIQWKTLVLLSRPFLPYRRLLSNDSE